MGDSLSPFKVSWHSASNMRPIINECLAGASDLSLNDLKHPDFTETQRHPLSQSIFSLSLFMSFIFSRSLSLKQSREEFVGTK